MFQSDDGPGWLSFAGKQFTLTVLSALMAFMAALGLGVAHAYSKATPGVSDSGQISGNGSVWSVPQMQGSDATLSALEITDSNGDPVSLDPGFSSGTTACNAIALFRTVTVNATPSASDATTVILLDGVEGTDGTATLDTGSNTITVQVTAGDAVSMQTYTIVVETNWRVLVRNNTHQGTFRFPSGNNGRFAQRITTGTNPFGYRLTSISLYFYRTGGRTSAEAGETFTLGLYSDNENAVGTKLCDLTVIEHGSVGGPDPTYFALSQSCPLLQPSTASTSDS